MRSPALFLIFALACAAGSLRGEDAPGTADIILPSSRKNSAVADSERNPFVNVELPKVEAPTEVTDSKSEEGRIEAVLEHLAVVGRTHGPTGWKILLGDLILEQGKTLPPVIAGQTQTLRVANIYDSMVEIEWAKKDPNDAHEVPKRIFIVVKLNPTVGLALSGQQASPGKGAQPSVITQPPNYPLTPPNELPPAQ